MGVGVPRLPKGKANWVTLGELGASSLHQVTGYRMKGMVGVRMGGGPVG